MFKKKPQKDIRYLLTPKYRFTPYGAYFPDSSSYIDHAIFTVRPVEFITELNNCDRSVVKINDYKQECLNDLIFNTEKEANTFAENTNKRNIEAYGKKINELENKINKLTDKINSIFK